MEISELTLLGFVGVLLIGGLVAWPILLMWKPQWQRYVRDKKIVASLMGFGGSFCLIVGFRILEELLRGLASGSLIWAIIVIFGMHESWTYGKRSRHLKKTNIVGIPLGVIVGVLVYLLGGEALLT